MSSSTGWSGAAAVFAESYEAFINTLSVDEKQVLQNYKDAQSMITSIRRQCKGHHINRSLLRNCCIQVQKISARIEPFFEIITIFSQSNADIACLVWGSLRLIFQLGQNYGTFLEKICSMLNDMFDVLPLYEEYVDHLHDKYTSWQYDFAPRLLKALSSVYRDILEFCFRSIRVLSPQKGTFARTRRTGRLLWRPFDLQFRDVLENFKKHTQLLEREIGSTSFHLIAQHCENVENEIRKESQERTVQDERRVAREYLKEVKEWIAADEWESLYEDIAFRRAAGSCTWLHSDPVYEMWSEERCSRDTRLTTDGAIQDVLIVTGKPGYGKTFLCASLIEHHRDMKDSQMESASPAIAFFFFSHMERDFSKLHPKAAFRAILAQLLHEHEREAEAIDALSLLMHNNGRGQLTASPDQVLSLLQWFLDYNPNTILIFDGIDECSDELAFYHGLEKIIGHRSKNVLTEDTPGCAQPGVALFTRPTLSLPSWISNRHRTIQLDPSQNWADIEAYVRDKLEEIAEDGLLGPSYQPCGVATVVRRHANGMFLWARLLIDYLNADGLSTNDRWEALNNLIQFEGLEQLYSLILRNLAKRLPQKSKKNLKTAFQWISCALRPLHIDELPHAIASVSEQPWNKNDVVQKLRKVLPRLSGALLEVAPDHTVRFTHTSVLEYLRGKHLLQDNGEEQHFHLNTTESQQLVALACLRYLSCVVPPKPLSGDSKITPEKTLQRKRLPLLEYCLEHWKLHLESTIANLSGASHSVSFFRNKIFQLLNDLVHSKRQIMAWMEAGWLFGHPPELTGLSIAVNNALIQHENPNDEFASLPEHLKRLSVDLRILEERWGLVLSKTPNEIWEPSIPAFTRSDYYLTTKEAQLISLSTSELNNIDQSVMLQSRVSVSGAEIGIIRLSIPKTLLKERGPMSSSVWIDNHSTGWKASYEVWNLTTKLLEFRFTIPLPPHQVKRLIKPQASFFNTILSMHSESLLLENLDLELPVSISQDLRTALILGCYVRINIEDFNGVPAPYSGHYIHGLHPNSCNNIEGTSQPIKHRYRMRSLELNPWTDNLEANSLKLAMPELTTFAAHMSPCGQFIVIARPSSRNGLMQVLHMQMRYWDLLVYSVDLEGDCMNVLQPSKLYVDRYGLKVDSQNVNDLGQHFLFHPFHTLLIFCLHGKIVAWDYGDPENPKVFELYSRVLQRLSISDCGNYLQGFTWTRQREIMVVVDISSKLSPDPDQDSCTLISHENTITGSAVTLQKLAQSHVTAPTSTLNKVNYVINSSGAAEMSVLRQFEEMGAVVLHTLSEAGIATSETITRLPKDLIGRSEPIFVRAEEDSDTVRLVLNQKPRASYSFREIEGQDEVALPVVLERKKASIPAVVINMGKTLLAGDAGHRDDIPRTLESGRAKEIERHDWNGHIGLP